MVYRASDDGALRQGEIITDVVQLVRGDGSVEPPNFPVKLQRHPYAIVLNQDCDLDAGHRLQSTHGAPAQAVPGVLLCELETAEVAFTALPGGDVRRRVKSNNDPRYQFLQQVAADEDRLGEGLPELTADFRRFFTVPTQELLSQIALPTALLDGEQIQAQRRCVLETPYMEHFCTRFAQYLARIALPEGHEST